MLSRSQPIQRQQVHLPVQLLRRTAHSQWQHSRAHDIDGQCTGGWLFRGVHILQRRRCTLAGFLVQLPFLPLRKCSSIFDRDGSFRVATSVLRQRSCVSGRTCLNYHAIGVRANTSTHSVSHCVSNNRGLCCAHHLYHICNSFWAC
jgi:hypothetical protein